MHPKGEDMEEGTLYLDGKPIGKIVEMPEVTFADCPEVAEEGYGTLGDMEITFTVPKNCVCRGGKKRFEKLCRGVLGMERNEIREAVEQVQRANREKSTNKCRSYEKMYKDMLFFKDFWNMNCNKIDKKAIRRCNKDLKRYVKKLYKQGFIKVRNGKIILEHERHISLLCYLPMGVPGIKMYGSYIVVVGNEDIGVAEYKGMPKWDGTNCVYLGVQCVFTYFKPTKDVEFKLEYGEEGADGGDG